MLWSNRKANGLRLAAGLALAVAAALLSACGPGGENRQLRVGFIVPKTGLAAPYGESHSEGAHMAVAEANQGGGISVRGRTYRVVLVEKDGSNSPEQALAAAKELINNEAVSAIVGPIFSGQAIPVARLADAAGVPMIVQIATNPEVTRDTQSVFRLCATDDFQGAAMARFVYERLAARRAATLFDVANAYNSGIAAIFGRDFYARGGRMVAAEKYTTGEGDFRARLRRIAAARPDVLFLPNYPNEILSQCAQMHEMGISIPIIGSDAMSFSDPTYMKAIEGAWYSVHFTPDDPNEKAVKFIAAYRARYRHEPDQGAALSYDALHLLFDVVRERESVEARKIVQGLRRLGVFEGVTGAAIFRGSADPQKGIVVVRMRDGSPRFEARIEP
jgi:branched-chain amino acid transport system substrate-binding protein